MSIEQVAAAAGMPVEEAKAAIRKYEDERIVLGYQAIIDTENAIQNAPSLTPELLLRAKEFGFTDSHISFLHKGDDSHAKEIKALRESFAKHGVEIPYNHLNVHILDRA